MPNATERASSAQSTASQVTPKFSITGCQNLTNAGVHDIEVLARCHYPQIGALFKAIARMTEKHVDVHALAELGAYLADDWFDMMGREIDCHKNNLADYAAAVELMQQGSGKQ